MSNENGLMYHIPLKKGDIGRYVLFARRPLFRTDESLRILIGSVVAL